MGFFNTVHYASALPEVRSIIPEDRSLFGIAERAADILRAPSQWLLEDMFGVLQTYEITVYSYRPDEVVQLETDRDSMSAIIKVVRIVCYIFLSIPGQLLALPLMALAFCDKEIRLKHKFTVYVISRYDRQRLVDLKDKLENLVETRAQSSKERSVHFILFGIFCLLGYLVYSRR